MEFLKLITHVTSTYPGFIGDDSNELLALPYPEIYRLMYNHDYQGSVLYNIMALG
jgi:hypothetical protein